LDNKGALGLREPDFVSSVGAGCKVIDRKTVVLALDGGFAEVFTKYHDTGESTAYAALKGGGGLVWKISETAEFNEKVELITELSDLGRFFLRLEAGLTRKF